jgi:hypothetical protein
MPRWSPQRVPDGPNRTGRDGPAARVDGVLAVYKSEGFKLAATVRAVGLVERALRGEVFTPRL